MSYKLKLDLFEGPLDLLLYLIRKNDLDIQDIPIADITGQYMAYIDMMKLLDLDVVGDFLVMAATLMQIKSKMLLPPDPVEITEVQEDPRDELVRRLQEYQQFKQVAGTLRDKETERKKLFPRVVDEEQIKELREDAKEVDLDVSLFDLIEALSKALQRVPEESQYEVEQEEYTVEQKIHDVLHLLVERDKVNLKDLFHKVRNRSELIVTFIAVLELIRLKEIQFEQKRPFADIEIKRNQEKINGEGEAPDPSAQPLT